MKKSGLFEEFPPVPANAWKQKIIQDLKGADYDKKLVWKTPEGFELQPFYREEDLQQLENLNVCPGDFPFLRGKHVKGNKWLVRQDIEVKDIPKANARALDIRMKGVDAIGFRFDAKYKPEVEEIEKLLENIRLDVMETNYSCSDPLEMVRIVDTLAKKYNRDLNLVRGSVDFDPLGYLTQKGTFQESYDEDFQLLQELFKARRLLTAFHVLTVDGSIFHNAGSGIVSQLAFALAKGADYLNFLTEKGFEIDEVAPGIRFHFAVGSSYFMEIAKFRAARYLWSHIVNAYGLNDAENSALFIHCTSSNWNKTAYDPYVNMLRTTTETMSALIAGVDSMTVMPFNAAYEEPTPFSERVARNQQLLLKYESYLDKVNDPAAGSYYIEQLTQQIIDKAWDLFLKIDEMGGYRKAFEKGYIQEHILQESRAKDNDIANRKRILLGTNQYPNLSDNLPDAELEFVDAGEAPESLIRTYRGASGFEKIRQTTDRYAVNHPRPTVWMLPFGNLAMRNARAQFAGNFFGCAGFEIINNPGFENIQAGIEAAKKIKPDIVVICGSDEDYQDNALKIFESLRDEVIVVLAGYPKSIIETLTKAGMNNFIHVRANVLEELKKYQHQLGIA